MLREKGSGRVEGEEITTTSTLREREIFVLLQGSFQKRHCPSLDME